MFRLLFWTWTNDAGATPPAPKSKNQAAVFSHHGKMTI